MKGFETQLKTMYNLLNPGNGDSISCLRPKIANPAPFPDLKCGVIGIKTNVRQLFRDWFESLRSKVQRDGIPITPAKLIFHYNQTFPFPLFVLPLLTTRYNML